MNKSRVLRRARAVHQTTARNGCRLCVEASRCLGYRACKNRFSQPRVAGGLCLSYNNAVDTLARARTINHSRINPTNIVANLLSLSLSLSFALFLCIINNNAAKFGVHFSSTGNGAGRMLFANASRQTALELFVPPVTVRAGCVSLPSVEGR